MARSALVVALWTILICFGWLLLAIAQGHAGCVLGMDVRAPVNDRISADDVARTRAMIDAMCRLPRAYFRGELAVTVLAGVAIGIVRAKRAAVPRQR